MERQELQELQAKYDNLTENLNLLLKIGGMTNTNMAKEMLKGINMPEEISKRTNRAREKYRAKKMLENVEGVNEYKLPITPREIVKVNKSVSLKNM